MYGYLKLDSKCPEKIQKVYRKNYCFLCRCLGEHYGFLSRFILSYDVTVFLLCVTNENYLEDIKKISCFNKEVKPAYDYEFSKSIAAFSLLLTYYKIKDDLNDEASFKAKTLYFLFKRKINRAKDEYPLMDKIIDLHYSNIAKLESLNKNLEEIADEFGQLLTGVAINCFNLKDDVMIKSLRYLARWVYFIDAIDDLDEDIKKNRFNPFKGKTISLKELVNSKYLMIKKQLDFLKDDIDGIEFSTDINHQIIKRVLFYSIPDTTFNILKEQ